MLAADQQLGSSAARQPGSSAARPAAWQPGRQPGSSVSVKRNCFALVSAKVSVKIISVALVSAKVSVRIISFALVSVMVAVKTRARATSFFLRKEKRTREQMPSVCRRYWSLWQQVP